MMKKEKQKYHTEEIKKSINNNKEEHQYFHACLTGLVLQMFGDMNHYVEDVMEILQKGCPPAELLQRIFAAKLRQMDFCYGEKVAERLRDAEDKNPEIIPSFLNGKERLLRG